MAETPDPETLDRGIAVANDPYAEIDLETLPRWWRESICEFRDHDLKAYQPARFADDKFVHETVEALESSYDVDISLIGMNVSMGDNWTVLVDETSVCEIGRHRAAQGYSVFEVTHDEFADIVRQAVDTP